MYSKPFEFYRSASPPIKVHLYPMHIPDLMLVLLLMLHETHQSSNTFEVPPAIVVTRHYRYGINNASICANLTGFTASLILSITV